MDSTTPEITELLNRIALGDDDAQTDLFRAIYQELRRLARSQRARVGRSDTLNTTALVHEAYARLAKSTNSDWSGRRHFFATAAVAMRNILVDEARRRTSKKRGGDYVRIEVHDAQAPLEFAPDDIAALDAALTKLEVEHPKDFEVAMLRYFTGMNAIEIGEMLEESARTVQRRWKFCRAFLGRELRDDA